MSRTTKTSSLETGRATNLINWPGDQPERTGGRPADPTTGGRPTQRTGRGWFFFKTPSQRATIPEDWREGQTSELHISKIGAPVKLPFCPGVRSILLESGGRPDPEAGGPRPDDWPETRPDNWRLGPSLKMEHLWSGTIDPPSRPLWSGLAARSSWMGWRRIQL